MSGVKELLSVGQLISCRPLSYVNLEDTTDINKDNGMGTAGVILVLAVLIGSLIHT